MAAGDDLSAALGAVWEALFATLEVGWVERAPGVLAAVSGLPIPTLNGLWPTAEAGFDPPAVSALLDRVAAEGVPHCLQARPSTAPAAGRIAADRGMSADEDIPLMVLDDPSALEAATRSAAGHGLTIRKISAAEADIHADVAARGFGAPVGVFQALVKPRLWQVPGVAVYVGLVRDIAVTTALCVTIGEFAGVFNVATPDEHRRRGFGGAITAQAALDGLAAGASAAWLQSSAAGYGVYERLGFRTVERWPCWITAGPDTDLGAA